MQARWRKIWAAALATSLAVLGAQAVGASPATAATLPPGSVKQFNTQSPFTTEAVKSFSASCLAGQRVLGGGAFTVGGVHAVITEMQPIHPATGVDSFKVTAAADQFGIPFAWSFQVFVFCATVPSSMQLEIVNHTDPPTSAILHDTPVRCPAGKIVVGTGGKIDNGGGQVDLGTGPNGLTGMGALAKEDADGFAGNYTVTAYAVCATSSIIADVSRVLASIADAEPSQKVVLGCPTGMELTGLAAETSLPGTHLQQIRPTQANLATFGTQSSTPQNQVSNLTYAVYCIK